MPFSLEWEVAKEEYRERSRPHLRRRIELGDKLMDGGLTSEEMAEYEAACDMHMQLLIELMMKGKRCSTTSPDCP